MASTATDWPSLANSPPPASCGDPSEARMGVTVCEMNAFLASDQDVVARVRAFEVISRLPVVKSTTAGVVTGTSSLSSATSAVESGRRSVLRVTPRGTKSPFIVDVLPSGPWKKAASAFRDEGMLSALEELCIPPSDETPWWFVGIRYLALTSVYLYSLTYGRHGSLHPKHRLSDEEVAEKYSDTRSWSTSPVRAISWHPHTFKIATASSDDSINIYTSASSSTSPVLKCKHQRGVTCMAWRPFFAGELAVGCMNGLLIWSVDPGSIVARPSVGCVSSLRSPGHAPVTSLSWHPNGSLLLSGSPSDSAMILWNTASETRLPLKRVGAGIQLVSWSPDPTGSAVVAATTNKVFRIWSTRQWTHERWNALKGHVNAACWSPDVSTLLFTTDEETKIYCLKFSPPNDDKSAFGLLQSSASAVPVMDLEPVVYSNEDGDKNNTISAGGVVASMRWDPRGDRLVISFIESPLLAVFNTHVSVAKTMLTPMGYIRGEESEFPSCFEFAKHFEGGALLTIAWSSGRLQHFPMFYNNLTTTQQDAVCTDSHLQNLSSTSNLMDDTFNQHETGQFCPQLFSSPTLYQHHLSSS